MIVHLDANIIIYFVEAHPVFGSKTTARLAAHRHAGDLFGVSELSRTECLVLPYRRNDTGMLGLYASFFGDPSVRLLEVSSAVCDRAARIRAAWNFKAPDALQLASAVEHGCGRFLTNDAKLASFTDVCVELL